MQHATAPRVTHRRASVARAKPVVMRTMTPSSASARARIASSSPGARISAPPPDARARAPTPRRLGVVARADEAEGSKRSERASTAPASRRVARRAPKTADGGAAAESASAPAGAKPKARRVRKLTQKVKDGAKTRQVISVDRREREAAALERFVEKKAKALRGGDGANRASGDATREEELSSALRDSGAVNERGESAGDRLRRLFAERRARGLGLVRDKFNDGGAAAAMESFSSGGGTDDQVDHLLDEAASVEEKNRRARDGYMDDTLGSNNSIDPFKLVAGEYVVHRKYGIGQFLGMKVLNVESASGDVQNKPFLFLKYKDTTAKISPDSSRRLLYRYCSPGGLVKPPKLNKLNDKTSWDSREKKTEATIRRLVVNQMVVYLQRLQSMRDPYPSPDAALTKRFEDAFPYTLTPDQCSAVVEITEDLQQDSPMDRLVIGDVGFGKTEVAMRAMFHVASTGGGVFMMAPTTVLAKQHAANLAARFRPLGINVELITRHIVGKKQRKVFDEFREGKVQIIVGTHRLVNLEEEYYDKLKLLVIDEEQRFGVKHKDQISALKAAVDVLTLSATPIPRTLHMAMAGFRDASLVQTPPPERRPINTVLAPQNDADIKRAVQFELDRKGQIYYIVPRINMMREATERLMQLFPNLDIMSVHGQMDGETIDAAMEKFSSGLADVLVATTIVESGLDIPNCNTIIIENVQFFGLSSLYQLRGRVGRADRQAFAYMFYSSEESELTQNAQERLAALEECCGLGEGFRLSERDMSIRGVGTMFGDKQSGDVDSVGADLYLELLYKQLQRIDNLRINNVAADDVRVGTAGYEFGITPFYIATTDASDEVKSTIDSLTFHDDIHATLQLMKTCFGEPDEFSLSCLFAREMRILAGELGIGGILLDNPTAPVIDLVTDASIMVKELLVEGISDSHDVEIIESGIRLKTMTDMTMHGKVMYTVEILRQITRSIPTFVKYL